MAPVNDDPQVTDTVPKPPPSRNTIFRRLGQYRDSIRNKSYRDSLLKRLTRQNVPEPAEIDSSLIKSEQYFKPFTGRVVRDIYYRQVKVFGPRNINDTSFRSNMKLLDIANRLHYNTNEWVIRQSLFFRESDTINPFTMADNERYLRNRPFIQDARLYIINTGASSDSVDLLVVTKDVFEYGFDLGELSTSAFKGGISNNNLFGAGQGVDITGVWRNERTPTWGGAFRYTKFNVAGSFVDASVGFTTLNDWTPAALDTGVLEGSYYININRPLYRTGASLVGGLYLASNYSINYKNLSDSLYRKYKYGVIDAWLGYTLINPARSGQDPGKTPTVALQVRHYNLFFKDQPPQELYKQDPVYNNRRYYLGQLIAFWQDFFKAHYFFGFGRTEDIPLGYNASFSSGWESWKGRRRMYTGLEMQKFWMTGRHGLFNTSLGFSSFWQNGTSEDAVLRGRFEYYSRLVNLNRWGRLRQFVTADYLGNPNPFFYKPLGVDVDAGIWGYRGSRINGFQRLNVRSETVYYSPLKILGFKFNFSSYLQLSQISEESNNIFKNPLHSMVGLGVRVRNENMSLNTLRIAAFYMPDAPRYVHPFLLEITTVTDFRFDISALRMPQFIPFR
ncbi:hypothetical protein F0L74_19765 [Chitinophaga agrisoli]|uniref:Uncharacterized protein n=1 Tax=Chitinophaga agrisoli TaxID=2607653 RepID=A0A5B2VIU7_9BACT|nr:hypothetical protein [Chitinophaga agrisoli]KAA2238466.1 hypothetical protein F0L74_19765 [Chitinophaga agrisoli]